MNLACNSAASRHPGFLGAAVSGFGRASLGSLPICRTPAQVGHPITDGGHLTRVVRSGEAQQGLPRRLVETEVLGNRQQSTDLHLNRPVIESSVLESQALNRIRPLRTKNRPSCEARAVVLMTFMEMV